MCGGWGGQHCFVLFHLFIFCSELFFSRLLSHWGIFWSVLRVADGATVELRGRRRPLPEASEPGGTRGPLKLMGGPVLTPLGLGIGPLLWEFFRSDVRITHWKHWKHKQTERLSPLRKIHKPQSTAPDPTENKTPCKISFEITTFKAYTHLELFLFTLCFSTILASCCKLPSRTARRSREADPKLSWHSQGSRGGLADRNHPKYRAAWWRWAGRCGTPWVTVQKSGGCLDAHRVFGPP